MSSPYDVLVVGSGIAGATVAYELTQRGKRVAVVEQGDIGHGASGAAGAFLSPMLGKANPLKTFVNRAFDYSTRFYKERVGEGFIQCGVLRMPKVGEDVEEFFALEPAIDVAYEKFPEGFFFPEGGLIPPGEILPRLLDRCDLFTQTKVESLDYRDGVWDVAGIKSRAVVLATGGYESLISLPFPIQRGVWGERIKIKTSTQTTHNYHRQVSLSKTVEEGVLYIGATHKKNHDFTIDPGVAAWLLEKAAEIMPIEAPEVVEIKAGMRPGSVDYYPIMGKIPDVAKNIEDFESICNGVKVPPERLHYFPGLYLHTGHGGRGFVTAPWTAKLLAEEICGAPYGDETLDMVRFFYRWMKREYRKAKMAGLS